MPPVLPANPNISGVSVHHTLPRPLHVDDRLPFAQLRAAHPQSNPLSITITSSAFSMTSSALVRIICASAGIFSSTYCLFAPTSRSIDTRGSWISTSHPSSASRCATRAAADSRISSVPGLERHAKHPDPARTAPCAPCSTTSSRCASLLRKISDKSGRLAPLFPPCRTSARTSFGKHDPPNANAGLKYAGDDVELRVLADQAPSPPARRDSTSCKSARSHSRTPP